MNALFIAAADIQALCAGRGWKCCVIGGLVVQRWGEPRQTRNVDVTLLTGMGGEEQFIDPILAHYPARLPDARRFALDHRVLLVETASGIPLDISLGGLPYEARVVERSTEWEVEPGVHVKTCSAEDLLCLEDVRRSRVGLARRRRRDRSFQPPLGTEFLKGIFSCL